MINFSNQEGYISPTGVHFFDEEDKKKGLPEIAVGIFSKHLISFIVEEHSDMIVKKVGYIPNANMHKDVYIINYKGTEIAFFMAGVGAPVIVSDIEDLAIHGVKKFIITGNCGVLDESIEDCGIIIPTKAFREEGTSYHYVPAAQTIDLNPKYIKEFEDVLDSAGLSHTKCFTWTTDAPYRETPEKIDFYKSQGALCVEMEGSAISAVCQYRHLDYFTFYYAGDNLDAPQWDPRSISGLDSFDKKKIVPFLCFELAHKIAEGK